MLLQKIKDQREGNRLYKYYSMEKIFYFINNRQTMKKEIRSIVGIFKVKINEIIFMFQ